MVRFIAPKVIESAANVRRSFCIAEHPGPYRPPHTYTGTCSQCCTNDLLRLLVTSMQAFVSDTITEFLGCGEMQYVKSGLQVPFQTPPGTREPGCFLTRYESAAH